MHLAPSLRCPHQTAFPLYIVYWFIMRFHYASLYSIHHRLDRFFFTSPILVLTMAFYGIGRIYYLIVFGWH